MKQKGKEWVDANGKVIPLYAINPVMVLEEKWSQRIAAKAQTAAKHLTELVKLTHEAHKEVYAAKVKDAEMKENNRPPDGMTINAFDHTVSVKITKPDVMYFDNTYTSLVQQKFDEYFNREFAGNDSKIVFIRQLVSDLMRTSGGKLDQNKVLQLRKYRASMEKLIQDTPDNPAKLFVEAVDLMDKAIKTKPGNTGLYVEVLNEKTGQIQRVPLKYTDV